MSVAVRAVPHRKLSTPLLHVPFFRPQITAREVSEVVDTLRSGWLTTGPKVTRFETAFGEEVRGRYAVSLNSCTAALHLAVEALGLKEGDRVLVPTMTFAATAEVVRYQGAVPLLVDCDPHTGNMDLADAEQQLGAFEASRADSSARVVGIMPVHVGGLMLDAGAVAAFARRHRLWTVEDAAHAFPAAWRRTADDPWQRCGEDTATVSCFSFYANKTITTGEGGMAITGDEKLADRMRLMSLHGLSRDAWSRYAAGGHWDYRIVAPGYKYNLTDVAAAIGIHQLQRAEAMRVARERIATVYRDELTAEAVDLPPVPRNRIHAWHLFPIRLQLDRITIDRNRFIDELRSAGITCSVHWRPLHLHPYYQNTFGLEPGHCPNATAMFDRIVSLPIFPGLTATELSYVVDSVKRTLRTFTR